jgi:hypothetical protein
MAPPALGSWGARWDDVDARVLRYSTTRQGEAVLKQFRAATNP